MTKNSASVQVVKQALVHQFTNVQLFFQPPTESWTIIKQLTLMHTTNIIRLIDDKQIGMNKKCLIMAPGVALFLPYRLMAI
jgi:hypothetical protein